MLSEKIPLSKVFLINNLLINIADKVCEKSYFCGLAVKKNKFSAWRTYFFKRSFVATKSNYQTLPDKL